MNHAKKGQIHGETVQEQPRLVLASVIDDKHLEIAGYLAHLHHNRAHDFLDSVRVVVGWKEGGK